MRTGTHNTNNTWYYWVLNFVHSLVYQTENKCFGNLIHFNSQVKILLDYIASHPRR
jgi:hypothetical protein